MYLRLLRVHCVVQNFEVVHENIVLSCVYMYKHTLMVGFCWFVNIYMSMSIQVLIHIGRSGLQNVACTCILSSVDQDTLAMPFLFATKFIYTTARLRLQVDVQHTAMCELGF